MAVLRILGGLASMTLGGLLGIGAGNSIWHQFLSPSRLTGRHQLLVGDFILVDHQVHLFLGLLSLVALALVLFGLYAVFFIRNGNAAA